MGRKWLIIKVSVFAGLKVTMKQDQKYSIDNLGHWNEPRSLNIGPAQRVEFCGVESERILQMMSPPTMLNER